MRDFIRRDPAFVLILIVGLIAGFKYFTGELHARKAWATFKVEHSCQAVSAVAWQCNDGKTYYTRAE